MSDTESKGPIINVEHKNREHGKLEMHFFIAINPNVKHSVFWFLTHTMTKSEIFAVAKETVRECGDELFIFDGILYQYDYGSGKFIKQRWENVEFDI